jgi:cysteine synthase B
VEVYAKAEWYNPSGSVKDRPAAAILRDALERGLLGRDRALLDSTSGNMGIAYATLGVLLGIRTHLVIPANASPQRLTILRALGSQLTLTDPADGSEGAQTTAAEIARRERDRYFYADQYSHPLNWQSHYDTTGPEIVEQTGGRITHFVAGLGTTGTMMGSGRYLKEVVKGITLVGVQPEGPMHGLEGLKHLATSKVPPIFDPSIPDEIYPASTETAYEMSRRLAREEGLLVGISAGAAAAAAVEIACRLKSGVVVALFPDSALKYLDLPHWRQP